MSDTTPHDILVLDKDYDSNLVETIFNLGYMVVVRDDLQEAVEKLKKNNFRAIILNYHNLSIDPLELVLNVREFDGAVPVIICNGYDDEAGTGQLNKYFRVYRVPLNDSLVEGITRVFDGSG